MFDFLDIRRQTCILVECADIPPQIPFFVFRVFYVKPKKAWKKCELLRTVKISLGFPPISV